MAVKEKISMDLVLDFQKTKNIVRHCIEHQEPIMLWGPPGIGKSDMMFEIGKELGRNIIDIRLSTYENIDIRGIPYREDDQVKWSVSSQFPRNPDATDIIFFDELNSADPSTQKAMYQMILNRRIGEYVLPAGIAMIAAGNREQDRGSTFSMPKPLENRFVHVEMKSDLNGWMTWALSNYIHREVIGFLGKMPNRLYNFDPASSSRAFATPRSWAKTSKLISSPNLQDEQILHLVSGCVGYGLATEFMAFRKICDSLPDPRLVLQGKIKKFEPADQAQATSLIYVLLTNLLYTLRMMINDEVSQLPKEKQKDETSELVENLFNFILENEKLIGPEYMGLAFHQCFRVYGVPMDIIQKNAAIQKIFKRYSKFFIEVHKSN